MARRRGVEWPTVLLIAGDYAVLGAVVWFHAALPWWVILPLGAYGAALHVSLQHEVLHGHPTAWRWLNEALVFLTPTFWLPYPRYRQSHLIHHHDANLTDPRLDPESYYMLPEDWAALPGIKQSLYRVHNTLAGRMALGPAISIVRFWFSEWRDIVRGDGTKAVAWAYHGVASGLTLGFIVGIAAMPLWQYLLLIAYPAISLALVRSFCEHRAAPTGDERTIIVEASAFWSLLFLNNNLHLAHHSRPALAWYKLPALYRAERAAMIARNDHYLMKGYGEIFRRWFLSAKEPVPHPHMEWLKQPD